MRPEFASKLEMQLSAYRNWAGLRAVSSCRLVHYAGVGAPSAVDVSPEDIEQVLARCIIEGYLVDWNAVDERVHLAVQEPGCPMPSWEKVFSEEELVDVDALLRAAGFADDA